MATAIKDAPRDQANLKPGSFGGGFYKPTEAPTVAEMEAKAATKEAPKWPSKVFEVEIPLCLLGKRIVHAQTPEEALERYKRLGGILQHDHAAKIREIADDTESFKECHLQERK